MSFENAAAVEASGRLRGAALAAGLTVAGMMVAVAIDRGIFWTDDFQSQYLPAYVDIARAVRGGELPLFSPWSWFGGSLAGEYQYGVFSAFLLPVVVLVCGSGLPFWAMAALLSAVHAAVAAAGCALLYRRLGAPSALAVGLAVGTASCGHLMTTNACTWFPGLAGFAWIPWLWLALDWAIEPPSRMARAIVAGIPLYLALSAGWPFTVAAAGLLLIWFAVRAVFQYRSLRAVMALTCTSIVGAVLAGPALVSLISYLPGTSRNVRALDWTMIPPPAALLGFWNPAVPAHWRAISGDIRSELSPDLFAGLLMAGAVPAVLARGGRALVRAVPWELALVLWTLFLMLMPSMQPFRWSFRWAPFLILAAGVMASRGWMTAVRAVPRGTWPLRFLRALDPLRSTALVSAVAAAAVLLVNISAFRAPNVRTWPLLILSLLPGLWLLVDGLQRSDRVRWSAALAFNLGSLCIATLMLQGAHQYMRWPLQAFYPPSFRLGPERTIISLHDLHREYDGLSLDPIDRSLLPIGNSGMLWKVPFVNGYSPLGPRGLSAMFTLGWSGFVNTPAPYIMGYARGLLQRMGVDYLVVPAGMPFENAEGRWRETARGQQLKLLERTQTSPRVRAVRRAILVPHWSPDLSVGPEVGELDGQLDGPVPVERPGDLRRVEVSPAQVEVLRASRLETVVRVRPERTDSPVLLVFAQPYYPGMRAWTGERSLRVWQADGMMPAVPLPAGRERIVVLSRLSRALIVSVSLTGVMALVVAAALLRLWRVSRRAEKA